MGKGKRKRERAERRQRRHLHPVPDTPPEGAHPLVAPLEDRPEYIAHMQAWREAGCPPGHGT